MKTPLPCRQFGAEAGHQVFYFHGTPGYPEECEIFDSCAKTHNLTFICYNRFALSPNADAFTYFQQLADEITDKAVGKSVDFVGFSIGAFIALQVCSLRLYTGN